MWIEFENEGKVKSVNLEGVIDITFSNIDENESRIVFQYGSNTFNVVNGKPEDMKRIHEYITSVMSEKCDYVRYPEHPNTESVNIGYNLPKIAKNLPNLDKCTLINE